MNRGLLLLGALALFGMTKKASGTNQMGGGSTPAAGGVSPAAQPTQPTQQAAATSSPLNIQQELEYYQRVIYNATGVMPSISRSPSQSYSAVLSKLTNPLQVQVTAYTNDKFYHRRTFTAEETAKVEQMKSLINSIRDHFSSTFNLRTGARL